jgi:hypothetical protein
MVAAFATGGGAGLDGTPFVVAVTGGVFSSRDDLGAVGGFILGGRVAALTAADKVCGGTLVDGEVVKVPCLDNLFSCNRAGW